VAECGDVEVAQLGQRERRWGESEADVRVRELCAQALAPGEHDLAVVERERGQAVDRVPVGVVGQAGIDARRDEAEIGGGELPPARASGGVAPGAELLGVGQPSHVDLGGEVASDRLVQGVARRERTARQGPGACERLAGALPEKRPQRARAHLQDDREHDLDGCCGRLRQRFPPHSLKP
jgi:hypothetical protein